MSYFTNLFLLLFNLFLILFNLLLVLHYFRYRITIELLQMKNARAFEACLGMDLAPRVS